MIVYILIRPLDETDDYEDDFIEEGRLVMGDSDVDDDNEEECSNSNYIASASNVDM